MLFENVFMVRGSVGVGPFNTDFNMKFIFAVATILMIIYDWNKNERLDYLWVTIFGTLIWSAAEAIMQLAGIRAFQQNMLFGIPLPLGIAIPFQGMVEGGFIAVTCLFLGDWMREKKTRIPAIIIFTGLMVAMAAFAFVDGIQTPNYGGAVPSRRNMSSIIALVFLGVFIYANIAFFIIHPRPKWDNRRLGTYIKIKPTRGDRIRGYYLFILMTIFGTVWTTAEYYAGTRWIEVGVVGSTAHAPQLIEFLALAFDVVVEITVAYIPFYTLPLGLKLIQSET
jgi:hypothetical protein